LKDGFTRSFNFFFTEIKQFGEDVFVFQGVSVSSDANKLSQHRSISLDLGHGHSLNDSVGDEVAELVS
jgi:hypothetical protein